MGETLVAPPSAPGGGGTGDGTVADGAVTTAKVAVGAITETKLAAALVAKLNAPPALVDDSVTTQKIIDGAVTEAKLEAALAAKVNTPAGQISTLDARIAAIEALGSLATDAELIAAVANILGTADAAGDTLGELEALMTLRLLKTNNLSDLANISTALTNLGFTAFSKTLLPLADASALRALVESVQSDSGFPLFGINRGATGPLTMPTSGTAEISGCMILVPPTKEDVWIEAQALYQQTALGTGQAFLYLYEGPGSGTINNTTFVSQLPNDLTKKYGQIGGKFRVGPSDAPRNFQIRGTANAAIQIFATPLNPCYIGAYIP